MILRIVDTGTVLPPGLIFGDIDQNENSESHRRKQQSKQKADTQISDTEPNINIVACDP